MKPELRIGIIGDYRPDNASHGATDAALQHAGVALGVKVQSNWLPTSDLPGVPAKRSLSSYDGLLCAPGSPFASMDGALAAIRYARPRCEWQHPRRGIAHASIFPWHAVYSATFLHGTAAALRDRWVLARCR